MIYVKKTAVSVAFGCIVWGSAYASSPPPIEAEQSIDMQFLQHEPNAENGDPQGASVNVVAVAGDAILGVAATEDELDQRGGNWYVLAREGAKFVIRQCASKAACRKIADAAWKGVVGGAAYAIVDNSLKSVKKTACSRLHAFC